MFLNGINCSSLKNGQVVEKMKLCLGINDNGYGSKEAEVLEDLMLSRAGKAIF